MHTDRIRLLRYVLRTNALTSFVAGAIALVAGSWVSRELGIDHVVATRLVGAGLVVFALDVALLSRASRERLLRDTVLVSAADIAWVAATVAVLITGILSTAGVWVASIVGLGVADFAVSQMWLRQAATAPDRSPAPRNGHQATPAH